MVIEAGVEPDAKKRATKNACLGYLEFKFFFSRSVWRGLGPGMPMCFPGGQGFGCCRQRTGGVVVGAFRAPQLSPAIYCTSRLELLGPRLYAAGSLTQPWGMVILESLLTTWARLAMHLSQHLPLFRY